MKSKNILLISLALACAPSFAQSLGEDPYASHGGYTLSTKSASFKPTACETASAGDEKELLAGKRVRQRTDAASNCGGSAGGAGAAPLNVTVNLGGAAEQAQDSAQKTGFSGVPATPVITLDSGDD